MSSKRMRGFTLIELMIALVILGILSAIALPAYNSQVVKTRRSDCMGTLLGFAQAMEKYYANNFSYLKAAASAADTGAPAGTLYPARCPIDGPNIYYDLTIQAAAANSYTVRATPRSAGSQADDGWMQVNSLGQKFWDKNDNDTIDTGENNWQR